MNEHEAHALLSAGQAGRDEWNRRLASGEQIPSISGFNLERTNLSGFDFTNVIFINSKFTGVRFHGSNLSEAEFENTIIKHSKFKGADLSDAIMKNAVFGSTVSFECADLRGVSGLRLNGEYILGAIFDVSEPWHRVARVYTGSRMTFILLFMSVAIAPRALSAFSYQAIAELQERGIELHGESITFTMWQVLLSWDMSIWFILTAIVLIGYSLARLAITWWISGLFDRQLISGYAPSRIKYELAAWLHRSVLRWVFWLSLISGLVQIVPWLFSEVQIPVD